jgi:hypothetical protein
MPVPAAPGDASQGAQEPPDDGRVPLQTALRRVASQTLNQPDIANGANPAQLSGSGKLL